MSGFAFGASFAAPREVRLEDVADRRDLDLGKRQVRPHVGVALTAHADDADTHAIARAHGG